MTVIREVAKAKVNLSLEIHGIRSDGYHELKSLVAFAQIGDLLEFRAGERLGILVEGPFADAIDEGENLILQAVRHARSRQSDLLVGTFRLMKILPVSAGLGGGSADAAAAVRILKQINPDFAEDINWSIIGADVPACLENRAALITGIGEHVSPTPQLPELPAVLVNPGVRLSTTDVFKALAARPLSKALLDNNSDQVGIFLSVGELIDYLMTRPNDLEGAAYKLAPVISIVKSALYTQEGCLLARLSGSGPTCFGLFRSREAAAIAASRLSAGYPDWWVHETVLQ